MFAPVGNTCLAAPLPPVVLETFAQSSDPSGLAWDKNGTGNQGFWVQVLILPPKVTLSSWALGSPVRQ